MKLYLYNMESKTPVLTLEDAVSYTANQVVTADGTVYGPFAEDCELSATEDCAGTLRADWRRDHPTAETRLEELEAENKLLREQVTALSDQNDFQEELIVELANIVYA